VLEEPPLFMPWDGWSCFDTGNLLLGIIIVAAAGREYEAEIGASFLGPLGLDNTGPSNTQDIQGLARGYVSTASGLGLPARTTDHPEHMALNPRRRMDRRWAFQHGQ